MSEKRRTRTMEGLELDALAITEAINHHHPASCAVIGEHLYRDRTMRGSAPYARIAGKVMRRLESKGQAVYLVMRGVAGWRLTGAGLQRIRDSASKEN